jgi:hypothetical protein
VPHPWRTELQAIVVDVVDVEVVVVGGMVEVVEDVVVEVVLGCPAQ